MAVDMSGLSEIDRPVSKRVSFALTCPSVVRYFSVERLYVALFASGMREFLDLVSDNAHVLVQLRSSDENNCHEYAEYPQLVVIEMPVGHSARYKYTSDKGSFSPRLPAQMELLFR